MGVPRHQQQIGHALTVTDVMMILAAHAGIAVVRGVVAVVMRVNVTLMRMRVGVRLASHAMQFVDDRSQPAEGESRRDTKDYGQSQPHGPSP